MLNRIIALIFMLGAVVSYSTVANSQIVADPAPIDGPIGSEGDDQNPPDDPCC